MNILSETTPLMFQWLPKQFENSVPNNENYPYLQRLVNWAQREPQRDIYLVVYGPGLKDGQMRDLTDKLKPQSNIKVIDFNDIELGKTDFTIPLFGEEFKMSEVLEYRYNKIHPSSLNDRIAKNLQFGVILDAMRIVMLQNVEKITGKQEAIYMDFDIFPDKNGEKLNEIKIPRGILMSVNSKNLMNFENSIIAINERGQTILSEIISCLRNYIQDRPNKSECYNTSNDIWMSPSAVYECMGEVLELEIISEYSKKSKEDLIKIKESYREYSTLKKQSTELGKLYIFQNSCPYVKVMNDNSWIKGELCKNDELPLEFNSPSSNVNNANIELNDQSRSCE